MKAEELAELLQTVPEYDVVVEDGYGNICDIRVDVGSGHDLTGKVVIYEGKVLIEA